MISCLGRYDMEDTILKQQKDIKNIFFVLYKRADIYKLVTASLCLRAQLERPFFGRVWRGVYGGSDPHPPNLGGTGKHKTRGDSTKLPPLQ